MATLRRTTTDQWKKEHPDKQHQYNRTPKQKENLLKQKKRRQDAERRIKKLCIGYLGSRCQYTGGCACPTRAGFDICTASYAFHHRKRASKKFQITAYIKDMNKSIFEIDAIEDLPAALVRELNKCDLLCQNCHHRLEYCDTCHRK